MPGSRAFRCRVCGNGTFRAIAVPRPSAASRETSFYECSGCSVMFLDPTAFNANEPGPPQSRGAQLPTALPSMSLKTYSRAQGITGKRIGGEPSSEAEHFETCTTCGQAFDMRDLGQVFHHNVPGHKALPVDG